MRGRWSGLLGLLILAGLVTLGLVMSDDATAKAQAECIRAHGVVVGPRCVR